MAHKKSGGTTKLGRDSEAKRLGVKKYGGEKINSGEIIVRQRGTKFHPGKNVKRGNDDTLYATKTGEVSFNKKKVKDFRGKLEKRTFVSVK